MPKHDHTDIVLHLEQPDELFESPSPGRKALSEGGPTNWDDLGAALGEPGVTRLLRFLQAQPRANRILVRVHQSAARTDGIRDGADLEARLRRWCEAKVAHNRAKEQITVRIGFRVLAACTGLLAVALLASWFLQNESVFGSPSALRTLASEAIVIAGWVVMWRPIEMLTFDRFGSAFERRLLERVPRMTISVEVP